MKNLANKTGMDLLPKGEMDKALEHMTPEEKQGKKFTKFSYFCWIF